MQTHIDAVVPFVFESLPVRGALIQLQKSWQRMQLGQNYQTNVLETLGHSAAATGLIAQSLKFDGTITMQLSGDGPLTMLVMQCTNELELRGMASAPILRVTRHSKNSCRRPGVPSRSTLVQWNDPTRESSR